MNYSDKRLYEKHASVENIEARLEDARRAARRAQLEVAWLSELLVDRKAQVKAGTWPKKEATP